MIEGIKAGHIVQVDPSKYDIYGGQFIIVDEVKSWGIQGYLAITREYPNLVRFKGVAYMRMAWEKIFLVGRAEWLVQFPKEEKEL